MVNRADGGPALKHARVGGVNRPLPAGGDPWRQVFHNLLWISGLGPPDLEGCPRPPARTVRARSIGVARHEPLPQRLESSPFFMTPCADNVAPDSTCTAASPCFHVRKRDHLMGRGRGGPIRWIAPDV